ncbi:MAG: cysteine synthase family protein [Deltaproteobacteria bacterium]|nr:cysteine synthase family protein [Deltaproteobacteria bacterium]
MSAPGRNPALRRFDSVTDLIGSPENPTPIVRLGRTARDVKAAIYLKLECMNPFGSIKDRTARALLEGLRRDGRLEGKELVEPTSGNTGLALAALANVFGIKCTVTIPDQVPAESLTLLKLLGATVWPTPDDLCPIDHPKDGAIALAHSIAADKNTGSRYVMPNQYENPDNVRAHYENTGPEIWAQTEGKVTHFFAGYGTCGTITGAGKLLKDRNPAVKVVAIQPQKNHRQPGLKNFSESKRPGILDLSVIDEEVTVPDDDAYAMAVRLAREEGILAGPSTGAILAGALDYFSKNDPGSDALAVAVSPDSALKYATFFADRVANDGAPPAVKES